jgi:thiol-disulfide isomerase/thioredoxin
MLIVSIPTLTLYKYWFNYVDFGSFSEKLKSTETVKDIRILTSVKDERILRGNGRILVLDFWNSGCVACFEKFPVLQKLSDKYSGSVDFFAVNVPFKNENHRDIFKKLPEIGYSFNTVIIKDSLTYKKLGVRVFPTTLMIDKDDKIIFRGDIESVEDVIRELLN